MAPSHQVDDLDSDYASSEDSDFAPDETAAAAADDDVDADVDSETETEAEAEAEAESDDSVDELGVDYVSPKKSSKPTARRKKGEAEAEAIGFENSGDEAVIGKGLKKQRAAGKRGSKAGVDEVEDAEDGGQGGFVKTRAMRAAEGPQPKKALASTETATVNVDELWEKMMAEPFKQVEAAPAPPPPQDDTTGMDIDSPDMASVESEDMITIERTYNFAGKLHSEKKLVPRHSAEAQLWLKSQPLAPTSKSKAAATTVVGSIPIDRPLRRPRAHRSVFEPAADLTSIARTDLRFKTATYKGPSLSELEALTAKAKAKKLTTVEKSKMDWAGYVDQEGLKEDLEKAGKRKGAYLDNQDFLARAEGRREEEGRRARGVVV